MRVLTRSVTKMTVAVAATLALPLSACATSEAPAVDEAGTSAETITVTDARGKELSFEGPAKRVGATEWNGAEYASSLGVDPVAVSDVKGFGDWDSAVELPSGTTDLGTRGEPSIDTVASAGLDVLLVTDELTGDSLQQIEQQGTKVVVLAGGDAKDPIGAMWKNIDLVAKITGTEDAASSLKKNYDAKIAETSSMVEESGFANPVAFVDGYVTGGQITFRPYGEGSLLGGVLKAVGLTNAWSAVPGLEFDGDYGLSQTDVEGLTNLPGDAAFWYIGSATDDDSNPVETLASNKVWAGLDFVQKDRVHRYPDSIWMFGGPASMMQFLDGVQAAVKG